MANTELVELPWAKNQQSSGGLEFIEEKIVRKSLQFEAGATQPSQSRLQGQY